MIEPAGNSHYENWPHWMQLEANVGAWSFDIERQDVWWSDQVYRIYELEVGTVVENPMGFYNPKDAASLETAMTNAIHNQVGWDMILTLHAANGDVKWIRSTGHPVLVNGKHVIQGICQDLSFWYKDLTSFQQFWKHSPDQILKFDTSGKILEYNLNDLPSISTEMISEIKMIDLENEDFKKQFHRYFSECLKNETVQFFKHKELKEKTKIFSYFAHRLVPIKIKDKIEGIFLVTTDVSREVIVEKQLEEEKVISERHSRLAQMGTLAAGVGHEINNPLAIVLGGITSMERSITKGTLDIEKLLSDLKTQKQACLRMKEIVSSLKNFARVRNEELWCCAVDTLNLTLNMVKKIYTNFGGKISNCYKQDVHCYVMIDRGSLQMALFNLLTNAWDATKDEPNPEIKISYDKTDTHCIIYIEDSGSGILDNIGDKIFDPFFTSKEPGQGTGLGLSISQKNIALYGGTIEFDNSSSIGGARFKVKIPLLLENQVSKKEMHLNIKLLFKNTL